MVDFNWIPTGDFGAQRHGSCCGMRIVRRFQFTHAVWKCATSPVRSPSQPAVRQMNRTSKSCGFGRAEHASSRRSNSRSVRTSSWVCRVVSALPVPIRPFSRRLFVMGHLEPHSYWWVDSIVTRAEYRAHIWHTLDTDQGRGSSLSLTERLIIRENGLVRSKEDRRTCFAVLSISSQYSEGLVRRTGETHPACLQHREE